MNIFNHTTLKSFGFSLGLLFGSVAFAQQSPNTENNLSRIEDPVHHSHSGNLAEGEKEFFDFVNSKPSFNESYEAARFIENKGQWNSNVLFRTELVDGAIFFEKNKLKYQFVDGKGFYDALHGGESEYVIKTHALDVSFVNASDNVKISKAVTFDQHKQSYFYADGKQASNVKFYQEVIYQDLYDGISVVYHSYNDHLKYDIRVAQGADPSQFIMNYDGAEHIFIDENGNLIIETTLSGIAEFAPYTYQIINGVETKVESRYVLNGTQVSFEFPNGYDNSKELIIDPSLVASTYTGSTSDNWGFTAGHTAAGDMVVAGAASGAGYPTTVGAFQTTWNGATTFPTGGLAADITVSIFSADGTTLIASSYLGGTNFETAHSLQVDQVTGDVYILGKTRSTDFPTTVGAFDQTHNGGTSDIFISRLNSSLTTLTASTFVGGTGVDGANVNENFAGTTNTKFSYGDAHRGQIVFDSAGDLYIVSSTQSGDFPTTVGAFDATLGGTQDAVVFKMDNLLTGLIYSTYLGGTAIDAGMGIAVDPSGNAYVVGATEGGGFPATAGTIDNTYNGNVDGFLTLLNATGTANTATTFLGTTAKDGAFYVDLDEANDPVVFGLSLGGTYPTTVGVYTDANSRQFVHGLSADLTTTNFSTIYGTSSGTPSINPTGFQVDSCGKIICGGWGRSFDGSTSTGLVTTTGAYQTTTDGSDFHFAVLGVNATSLVYATFVGENVGVGDHVDGGSSTFDDKGIIYQAVCASCGGSNGFPTTAGASSSTNNAANCNNAVFKFDLDTYAPNAAGIAAVGVGCLGFPVTFTNTSGGATSYEWNFGDGSPVSTATNPSHTYTATGTYTVQLVAFNPTACITSDTTSISIDIDQPTVTVTTNPASGTICNGDNVTMTAGGANTYTWTPGPFTGNPYVQSPTTTTTYQVIGADANGCEDTVQVTITVDPQPTGANAGTDQTVCETPGTATLAGNTPGVGSGVWTLTSGTGTITTPSSPTSGLTGLGVGANVFTWTITSGVCTASSDDVTINVDADPTTANAGLDQTQCETITTATLSGNTPTSGTGAWTVIAGGGTVTTPGSPTSGVTGLTTGTNTFQWTITNGTCAPSTDQITITLDAAPTAANAGTDQTVCETPGTATLAGNTPAVGTGTWTLTSGTGTITTPSSPTSGVTGLGVGANVFTWTTSNGTCPTSSDNVTINVDADATTADAGPDQTQCETITTATLSGNTPTSGTGAWTVIAGGGTVTTPGSPTSGVTGLTTGTNTFQWTITNGTCAPSTDQITITLDAAPTAANAGTDQTVCETPGTATLAGNTPAVGTGTWTLTSGTGTITTPSSPNSGVTGLGVGANVFTWTTSNGTCPTSSDNVTINVDADATTADAGPDQTQCETITTATLSGNTPTSGTGAWTVIAGGGTVTTPGSPTSGVTGLTTGTNTFQWTITNGTCAPSTDQITITLDAAPTAANAGTDQTVCETPGTATLAGNTPAVGTGTWTLTSGTGTITTPSSPTSGVTGLGVGANVFTWTTSNGTCPTSSDNVTINVDADATTADAGPDQTQCETITTATLSGNTPTSGTGAWTVIAGGGTVTTPGSPTSGVTGLTTGTNTFQWTITNGTCAPSTDQITITLDAAPTAANAGTDQTVCETPGTATLAGNSPAVGTGTWTLTSGTGTITTPSSPTSGVTGLGVGANVFTWTTSNGTCPTSSDDVTINVDADATTADAGPDQDICVDNTTLAGNIATSGAGVWTLVSGSGTITTPTSPTTTVTGLGAGANVFEWTITNGTCAPSADQVTINVTPDTDGDLVCDGVDEDDDNDGIPDVAENPGDSDGDGIPDSLDLDSDNDGIPDIIEAGGTDADGDGEVDYPVPGDPSSMTDVDGDGVDDNVDPSEGGTALPNPDSDGDGVNDATDLDADNDGTPDIVEAGGTDADGDGQVDGFTDVDGDGFADINDTDDNTVPGTGDGGTPLANPDTDNDGVVDVLDLDSDNDGIADIVENGGTDTDGDGQLDGFTDVDGDGFGDAVDTDDNTVPGTGDGGTNLPGGDFDQDGIPNNLDLDSDNDGITDANEAGGTDADGDGILDGFADVDGDGFSDVVDTDDNTVPGTGDGGTTLPTPNTDGTGNADYLDIDADDDGIIDNIEGQTTAGYNPPLGTDSDNDGIDDQYDPDNAGNIIIPNDHDGDSTPDYQDLDSDNDGESDLLEGHDLNGNGVIDGAEVAPVNNDADGDGLDDAFDTVVLSGGTAGTNAGNGTVDPATDGVIADADSPLVGDLDFREADSDGDGIDDATDEDDDNDGIPDVAEGSGDTDGDGIPDSLDLDSDNDGIPDIIEAGGTDVDGDGEVDYPVPGDPSSMTDVDGDGVDDNVDPSEGGTALPNPDSDGDGVNDVVDLDADNDGIPDVIEAGGTDVDGDGVLDGYVDVDGDGFNDTVDSDDNTNPGTGDLGTPLPNGDADQDGIPNNLDVDSDNDGITDATEAGGIDADGDGQLDGFTDVDGDGFTDLTDTDDNTLPGAADGGTSLPMPNTDGTGGVDYLDIDADGDGIPDNVEGQTSLGYTAPTGTDTDGDGLDDAYDTDNGGTPITPVDTDIDGTEDYLDLDSDNDGESDLLEGHDLNGNGVIDGAENAPANNDADGDGLDDAFDTVVLSGGTAGTNAGNGTTDPLTDGIFADADNPGVGNLDFREIDNDGDGIDDSVDEDDDNDGIPDVAEGTGDTDGDGIPDSLDLDSDNDGIPDIIEAGGTDADGDGEIDYPVPGDPGSMNDTDGDGLDNSVDTDNGGTPLANPDSDGDGVNDVLDLDSDNDGTPDAVEAGGTDVDGDGILDGYVDVDGDGFNDTVDSDDNTTPGTGDLGTPLANPDTDNDGVVDVLDLDSDNDGIADIVENGGTDTDGDGQLDGFTDVDGDGFGDAVDTDDNTVPGTGDGGTNLPGGDFDQDGIPNNLDLDSDNDGITDANEAGGTDADGDGILDGFADVDGDGFSDVVDTDDNTVPGTGDGGTTLPTPNTDGTGNADYLDIDADDDGIIDNIEGQTTAGYNPPLGTDSDNDGIDDQYDPDNAGNIIIPNDHDGDSTPDYQDLDSDNDGESDLLEGHDLNGNGVIDGAEVAPVNNDADGDGLDDAFDAIGLNGLTAGINGGNGTVDPATDGTLADADSPFVGDLDFRESDNDGDGIDDAVDEDDDNDGIPDVAENGGDTDGDGIPDIVDLDSDNDGIPDIIEAGGTDADGDGQIDYPVPGDPGSMNDSDGDGLDDSVDPDSGGTPLTLPDTDGDGVNDVIDLDSDNDGTPDVIEAGGTDVDGDGHIDGYTDNDNDGFDDTVDTDDNNTPGTGDGGTSLPNPDTDNDGVNDVHDLDSDNDGIPDVIENGGADADGDGILDGYSDVDGDGYSDVVDSDDDTVPGTNDGGTPLPNGDFDMDGIPNAQDVDSDNDGITDATEAGGVDADGDGILDGFADVDGDGFSDVVDTDDNSVPGTNDGGTSLPVPNTDGSQGDDYLDIDSDNDGIPDNVEGQTSAGYNPPSGTDSDGDGLDDEYDPDNTGNIIIPTDTDFDGTPDYTDLDSDNDGENDLTEGHDLNGNGVIDGTETAPSGNDTDGDGLDDAFDTEVLTTGTANTNAANGTTDPFTDGVFADADNPGIGDLDWRELDTDGDGISDYVDLDDDNDGIPDSVEDLDADMDGNPYTNPTDTDNDGIPDIWDLDSDNDGIPDIVEAGGTDANNDGRVDDLNVDGTLINDTDNDGLDDLYDGDNGGTDIPNPDTDGDGHNDFQDVDSDNDGIYDIVEDGGFDNDNNGQVDDWADADGDQIPDYADADATGGTDVDGDGIDDSVDVDFTGGTDTDGDGIDDNADEDPDGDGWDNDDATGGDEDTDGDGIPDYQDLDSDNDGTPDIVEDGGTDADGDGMIDDFNDTDGDGADDDDMTDGLDDVDGDGIPDHEDLDSDNDGITDANENGKPDVDGDGVVDDFTDNDGDGWDDVNGSSDPTDTDGDGIPDQDELDSDNDGIPDIIEGGDRPDVDGDGMVDDFTDTDGDGLDDNGGSTPPDTDGDGVPDYQDQDSDDDGVPDSEENDPDGDGQGPDDTDGDGIPDYLDIDDDNDGILTSDELDEDGNGDYDDCDGDALPDYLDADACGLEIPEGFSPNDDGVNDLFVIKGIGSYPDATITIYNRWGNKVYESINGYANDWDGHNLFGMTTKSRALPAGTYFYVLDLGDGSEVIKGYVYLNR